ncbi:MAG: alpha/beta fold hydrolase, partial [Bdellovibrionota bacterium]
MTRIKKIFWSVLRVGLVLYVAIAVGVYFFQESLLFHASHLPPGYKFELKLPFEERMVTGGPDQIDGLLVHPPKAKGLLLYFHGNAGNLEDWAGEAEELASITKWNVWIIDYPGFGKSSGSIHSEEQLHADADAVFTAAKKEAGTTP